jgi:adenylate cyclase
MCVSCSRINGVVNTSSVQFYHMHRNLIRKLKALCLICLFTSFAGVVYQLINEERLTHHSVLFGLPLGLGFGVLELFVFPNSKLQVRRWSFTKILIFKTVVYTAAIYAVSLTVTIISGFAEGHRISELPGVLASPGHLILILYTLLIYGLLVFFLQIENLLGEGVIWKFISGKYHEPREEQRIFMFLDMYSSTTAAEKLGHEGFYNLLNEVFHEISEPAIQTKAEIYQYVGDEVVLTWNIKHGLQDANCLKSFFMFKNSLKSKSDHYLKTFGLMPGFKAGLHFGNVVCAQIGDLKRQIVYNGDVVNTASRIQDQCKKYQRDCLVSGDLFEQLKDQKGFSWERVDTVALRGKEKEVDLYGVTIAT